MTSAFVLVVVAALAWAAYLRLRDPEIGKRPNREAWEATYQERGLPVPSGPRDDYWNTAPGKRVRHATLGWHEPAYDEPGRLTIDERGWQYYRSRREGARTLLVTGGSVAFGAYASDEAHAWFHRLGALLDEDPRTAVDVVVVASVAWKTQQEVASVYLLGEEIAPDWVVAINGLNDITNGSRADTLFGVETETHDGSTWSELYHAHDYADRVVLYVENVAKLERVTQDRGAKLLVVLQPALFEREPRSHREEDLLERTLPAHASLRHLVESYESLRKGLDYLSTETQLEWLDASRLFEGERATTFTDMWHFSDPGHERLAGAIADRLGPLLLADDGRE